MYLQVKHHNLLETGASHYGYCFDILKLDKSDVAMVGDLYDTDIMSGINVGVDTIHVQTGVTTYEELKEKRPTTYIFI